MLPVELWWQGRDVSNNCLISYLCFTVVNNLFLLCRIQTQSRVLFFQEAFCSIEERDNKVKICQPLKNPLKQTLLQGHLLFSEALPELLEVSLVSWSANDIICLASKPVFSNLYLAPSNLFSVMLLTALLDNLIILTDGNFILLCFLDISPHPLQMTQYSPLQKPQLFSGIFITGKKLSNSTDKLSALQLYMPDFSVLSFYWVTVDWDGNTVCLLEGRVNVVWGIFIFKKQKKDFSVKAANR